MTRKKELDDLATMCLQCADGDASSLSNHLASCPVCVEYSEKAESFNITLEVLEVMAAKPEKQRREFLETRFQRYFSQPDEVRKVAALRSIMDAMDELPEKERLAILETRTRILVSLPTDKRKMLLRSMKTIYSDWAPSLREAEWNALHTVTSDFPFFKRAIVRSMHKNILNWK
jgi:hypothetical protein